MLKFTDHDVPIDFTYGGTAERYDPAGGWTASAREKQAGIRDSNLDTKGVLTADTITDDDLRAGLYREARVVEMLVDYRFPYAGTFQSNTYYIANVQYTKELWNVQLSGEPAWLRKEVGTVLSRVCRHDLGKGICGQGVNLEDAQWKLTGLTVTTAIERRRVFTSAALATSGKPAGWATYGEVVWTTGRLAGLRVDVMEHTAGGRLQFALQLPYDFNVGDEFTLYVGCDHLFDTCKSKFNNVPNHGGYPAIVGTDNMVGPPRDKTKTF